MTKEEKWNKIHSEAIACFNRIQSALYLERKQCSEDRRFYSIAGAQWEGSLGEQFEKKPKFEVNKVHLSVMRIINEYRNNRISVDFVAKDGRSNDSMAEVCDGLFRADERDSTANEAYDNSFEEAVGGGFGAFRLTAQYEDEEDDDNEYQRIRIEPIYDADESVFFDLDAKRQDKADAKYAFVMSSMSKEDFEEEWGVDPSSVPREIDNSEYDWYTPDLVYIAEFYKVESKRETVYVYKTITGGEEKYTDEDFKDDPELEARLEEIGTQKIREKKVRRKRVHKYIISGSEILEDCGIIAGKNIPIIPVYGKRWFIDSVERCMGHVRLAKDAQRIKNMLTSKLAEISSLSTVEKPILTPQQVAGHEYTWAEDNIHPMPYLLVNPIETPNGEQPAGPVGYTKPPAIPPALAALLQQADVDINELLGNQNNADQMVSHVSGKAREMLQKRIDGQAFIYMDNFAKAIQRTGEVWLSMAKEVYVEKGRKMKTLDSMGEMSSIELLMEGKAVDGTIGEQNDLTKATFDVSVDVGPTAASQREATVQTLMGMLAVVKDQDTAKILQMMAFMNMEGDGISEARAFFRKQLVKMGVITPTAEEAQMLAEMAKNRKPSPQEQALIGMAQEAMAKGQKAQMEVKKVQTDAALNLANVEKTKAQTQEIYAETGIKQVDAGIKLGEALSPTPGPQMNQ